MASPARAPSRRNAPPRGTAPPTTTSHASLAPCERSPPARTVPVRPASRNRPRKNPSTQAASHQGASDSETRQNRGSRHRQCRSSRAPELSSRRRRCAWRAEMGPASVENSPLGSLPHAKSGRLSSSVRTGIIFMGRPACRGGRANVRSVARDFAFRSSTNRKRHRHPPRSPTCPPSWQCLPKTKSAWRTRRLGLSPCTCKRPNPQISYRSPAGASPLRRNRTGARGGRFSICPRVFRRGARIASAGRAFHRALGRPGRGQPGRGPSGKRQRAPARRLFEVAFSAGLCRSGDQGSRRLFDHYRRALEFDLQDHHASGQASAG